MKTTPSPSLDGWFAIGDDQVVTPGTDDDRDVDLICSAPTLGERLRLRWSALPLRHRAAIAGSIALFAGLPVAVVTADRGYDWLTERGRRDKVALTATAGYWSSSTSPSGGRINFFVTVHNTGPRPIRIDSLRTAAARLTIRSPGGLHYLVLPAESVNVPVSIRLDCLAAQVPVRPDDVRSTIAADPLSGRRHAVTTALSQAALFTHLADNLCRIEPGLRDQEMSDPVV
ncbi:MAG: hypothetical protein M3P23_01300 [Actinomycetota bacterium]|nr:hypothetical protein [Actinomycetota bacterium]